MILSIAKLFKIMLLKSILRNQREIKYLINNQLILFQIHVKILKFYVIIKDYQSYFIMIKVNRADAKFYQFIVHFKMKFN